MARIKIKQNGEWVYADKSINPAASSAISYDNTTSGLTATNVKAALDEVAAEKQDLITSTNKLDYSLLSNTPTVPSAASDITYDNTTSGLDAEDVKDALDELASEKQNLITDSTPIDATSVYYDDQISLGTTNIQDAVGILNTSINGKAAAPLIGTTATVTPADAITAVNAGRITVITYPSEDYGNINFSSFTTGTGAIMGQAMTELNNGPACFRILGISGDGWYFYTDEMPYRSDVYTKTESDAKYILKTPTTWAEIKDAVRRGFGPALFPVGYEFTVSNSIQGNTKFVVRHHDYDPLGTELQGGHNMLIEQKYAYGTDSEVKYMEYDNGEFIYVNTTGDPLPAGTYNFTVPNTLLNFVAGTYEFTTSIDLPNNGNFMIDPSFAALTTITAQIYDSDGITKLGESTTIASGSSGTSLGSLGVELNTAERVLFGSDNYYQSGVRQWLNSAESKENWWTKQTKYDFVDYYYDKEDGYMKGFSNDFLAAIKTQKIPCKTANYFEIDSLDGTTMSLNTTYTIQDKFFLLSCSEIYGTYESTTDRDGTILDGYQAMGTDATGLARRILYAKSGGSSGYTKLTRSSYIPGASRTYGVSPAQGNYGGIFPCTLGYTVAPACIIG